jgi:hypothetical protein
MANSPNIGSASIRTGETERDTLLTLEQAVQIVPLGKSSLRRAIRAGQLEAFQPAGTKKFLLWKSALLQWATGTPAGGGSGGGAPRHSASVPQPRRQRRGVRRSGTAGLEPAPISLADVRAA